MSATEFLRSQCQSDWDAATQHVFCSELADGTLPISKMKWYLAQDYKFIDGFVRLLATAVAHAPTLADSVPAAQFLAVITGPENTYFLRSFEALDMTEGEINAETAPETKAFQELMDQARHSGRYEEMLAVLVAAEWTYLSWAEPFENYSDDLPFWFAEWIDLHCGDYFSSVVNYLREQLDQCWLTLDEAQQQNVLSVFKRAMAFERAFFDASYQQG